MRTSFIVLAAGLVANHACISLAHEADGNHASVLLGAVFPQVSRSGETVAFSYQGAIWQMPREGDVMTQLTAAAGFDVRPTWSPDNKCIAFIRGHNSLVGPVHMVHADDGKDIKLPKEVVAKDKLFFDREGKRILSIFRREGGRYSLCWLEVLTGNLGSEVYSDVWGLRFALSQDGNSIALVTTQDIREQQGGNNGPACDLWIVPVGGGDLTKVVHFPGRVYDISWTADDQALYVVTNVGGVHNDLWKVPLKDALRGMRKLTFGQADEDSPSVSRSDPRLWYTDNRHGPTALVVRDPRTKQDSVVTVLKKVYHNVPGTLSIEVSDSDTSGPTTARVSVRQLDGKFYAPPSSLYRMLKGEVHFYCQGATEFSVPAGEYLVKVARGPEYAVAHKEVEVPAGKTTSLAINLNRWTNQQRRGWYSGESHIHANYGHGQWYNSPRTMLAQCAGEDLVVCNFMVANSEADGVFDREFFRGAPDPLSTKETILYWNEEFRSTIWGHMTLLNLKQLIEPIFTGFAHTTHSHDHPTNADVADLTHDQHAHVNYTHPAHNVKDPYLSAYSAKALPLDMALGKVDSIDVMGSNHVATMPLWYRLLNCGFHVPASAGTDCFLNRVSSRLPGQDRVYVRVKEEFHYQRWIDNLKAGRTFVTNGPMFDFSVNGLTAGDTVTLKCPSEVCVRGRVESQYPLNRVEVIYNGKVMTSAAINDTSLDVMIDKMITIPRSGWIAIRAAGPPHPQQPDGTVFGHTSAVYIDVADRPVDARRDAEYFVKWIDRLRTDIRRRNRTPGRYQVAVESQIAEARAVYLQLANAITKTD